jgi:hypothetical protein
MIEKLTDRYLGEHNMETATDELPRVKYNIRK